MHMEYYILGNADYAKMLFRYINKTDKLISGFVVDLEFITDRDIQGIPVYSFEKFVNTVSPESCKLFMGIGYRDMNRIKEKEFLRYKGKGYQFENYIHPTAIIDSDVELGEANNIFEGVIIQEGVRIGDANLIYGGAMIAHETTVGDYNSFSVKSCVAGCAKVGNSCFIGANATVKDHICLANYTLVGAGTYANKSTGEYDVVVSSRSQILEGRKSVEFI